MACLRLGSKSEAFHREGNTWICTSGLPSDITIEVGDMSFHLHKFPLLSRSGLLEKLIEELNSGEPEDPPPFTTATSAAAATIPLHDLPGGAKAFELVAKFCYGVRTELSAANVVALRCASDFLRMTEDVDEGNLVSVTEAFLDEILASWPDTLRALESVDGPAASAALLPAAEDLHIVSRCIDSLASKIVSQNPNNKTLTLIPLSTHPNMTPPLWNGISSNPNPNPNSLPAGSHAGPQEECWWFDDVSSLSLPLFKRLILAVQARSAPPETVAAAIIHYAKKYLPMMSSTSSGGDAAGYVNPAGPTISESEQRSLTEELVLLLPSNRGAASSKTLLRLLRIAMMIHVSPSCIENLERRIGSQLDQALLVDLLVPNMGYSAETLYDIDCVHRIVDHFMAVDHGDECDGREMVVGSTNEGVTSVAMVANLVDGYLAEVAVDVNMKMAKFQALAALIPDYVRPVDDGIYNAIDVYLKAHPWVSDSEREQLCRLMNCQKLSLEASTHAAQNERLPLRVIVQVLFFEQLRLRTSISSWFFVSSDPNEPSQNLLTLNPNHNPNINSEDDVRARVSEIEKECSNMRKELQKLVKAKKKSSWSLIPRFGFRRRVVEKSTENEESKSKSTQNDGDNDDIRNHVNGGEVVAH